MPPPLITSPDTAERGDALNEIVGFHLVTSDLPRLVEFYHEVLGFAVESGPQPISAAEMALLAILGHGTRQVLSIGSQCVAIEQFESAGRLYLPSGDAASLWFQHLALVVVDVAASHARLRGVSPISLNGPQELPPSSGGVKAFKFRDPDGHPLELLEFPFGKVPETWKRRSTLPGQIALGIDHTAISVGDVAASKGFYTGLGLMSEPVTLNTGREQQELDDLQNVRVLVAPLRPEVGTPHLELLGYEVPRGTTGPELRPNDVAATRVAWKGTRANLLADPDGHLHQVVA